jgi:light-independent protochlorophyllide reductase subunit L
LNIADQLLTQPEGVVAQELEDRNLFRLLSDFYLQPTSASADGSTLNSAQNSEEQLDFMLI